MSQNVSEFDLDRLRAGVRRNPRVVFDDAHPRRGSRRGPPARARSRHGPDLRQRRVTRYDTTRLQTQLAGWVERGIPRVKMKVGRDAGADRARVCAAREAIGDASLFVDANGAYSAEQALAQASVFAESGVSWFEEPVSSDDLRGLRELRTAGPPGMEIAAGEYGFTPWYVHRMLAVGAVDCVQADAKRCPGFTGFRVAADLACAFGVPFSAHRAPSIHAHRAAACSRLTELTLATASN